MKLSESQSLEIWDRLFQGKSLDNLSLEKTEGRINLRGLSMPAPAVVRKYQVAGYSLNQIEPGAHFVGAKWKDLDFTGSELKSVRFFDSELRNCVFENCQMQDFRVWSSKITETSFKGADLKKSALGGVRDGKRNIYACVDFSDADLRETAYKAASFDRCTFRNSKLVKIDFQTSTFENCVFVGELRDVLFYRRGFGGDTFPPNEMINVDFKDAVLHDTAFRGLRLDKVKLPRDDHHILIANPVATIERIIEILQQDNGGASKKLTAFLNIGKKWAPVDQAQNVINVDDLEEIAGFEGVSLLRDLLAKLGSKN